MSNILTSIIKAYNKIEIEGTNYYIAYLDPKIKDKKNFKEYCFCIKKLKENNKDVITFSHFNSPLEINLNISNGIFFSILKYKGLLSYKEFEKYNQDYQSYKNNNKYSLYEIYHQAKDDNGLGCHLTLNATSTSHFKHVYINKISKGKYSFLEIVFVKDNASPIDYFEKNEDNKIISIIVSTIDFIDLINKRYRFNFERLFKLRRELLFEKAENKEHTNALFMAFNKHINVNQKLEAYQNIKNIINNLSKPKDGEDAYNLYSLLRAEAPAETLAETEKINKAKNFLKKKFDQTFIQNIFQNQGNVNIAKLLFEKYMEENNHQKKECLLNALYALGFYRRNFFTYSPYLFKELKERLEKCKNANSSLLYTQEYKAIFQKLIELEKKDYAQIALDESKDELINVLIPYATSQLKDFVKESFDLMNISYDSHFKTLYQERPILENGTYIQGKITDKYAQNLKGQNLTRDNVVQAHSEANQTNKYKLAKYIPGITSSEEMEKNHLSNEYSRTLNNKNGILDPDVSKLENHIEQLESLKRNLEIHVDQNSQNNIQNLQKRINQLQNIKTKKEELSQLEIKMNNFSGEASSSDFDNQIQEINGIETTLTEYNQKTNELEGSLTQEEKDQFQHFINEKKNPVIQKIKNKKQTLIQKINIEKENILKKIKLEYDNINSVVNEQSLDINNTSNIIQGIKENLKNYKLHVKNLYKLQSNLQSLEANPEVLNIPKLTSLNQAISKWKGLFNQKKGIIKKYEQEVKNFTGILKNASKEYTTTWDIQETFSAKEDYNQIIGLLDKNIFSNEEIATLTKPVKSIYVHFVNGLKQATNFRFNQDKRQIQDTLNKFIEECFQKQKEIESKRKEIENSIKTNLTEFQELQKNHDKTIVDLQKLQKKRKQIITDFKSKKTTTNELHRAFLSIEKSTNLEFTSLLHRVQAITKNLIRSENAFSSHANSSGNLASELEALAKMRLFYILKNSNINTENYEGNDLYHTYDLYYENSSEENGSKSGESNQIQDLILTYQSQKEGGTGGYVIPISDEIFKHDYNLLKLNQNADQSTLLFLKINTISQYFLEKNPAFKKICEKVYEDKLKEDKESLKQFENQFSNINLDNISDTFQLTAILKSLDTKLEDPYNTNKSDYETFRLKVQKAKDAKDLEILSTRYQKIQSKIATLTESGTMEAGSMETLKIELSNIIREKKKKLEENPTNKDDYYKFYEKIRQELVNISHILTIYNVSPKIEKAYNALDSLEKVQKNLKIENIPVAINHLTEISDSDISGLLTACKGVFSDGEKIKNYIEKYRLMHEQIVNFLDNSIEFQEDGFTRFLTEKFAKKYELFFLETINDKVKAYKEQYENTIALQEDNTFFQTANDLITEFNGTIVTLNEISQNNSEFVTLFLKSLKENAEQNSQPLMDYVNNLKSLISQNHEAEFQSIEKEVEAIYQGKIDPTNMDARNDKFTQIKALNTRIKNLKTNSEYANRFGDIEDRLKKYKERLITGNKNLEQKGRSSLSDKEVLQQAGFTEYQRNSLPRDFSLKTENTNVQATIQKKLEEKRKGYETSIQNLQQLDFSNFCTFANSKGIESNGNELFNANLNKQGLETLKSNYNILKVPSRSNKQEIENLNTLIYDKKAEMQNALNQIYTKDLKRQDTLLLSNNLKLLKEKSFLDEQTYNNYEQYITAYQGLLQKKDNLQKVKIPTFKKSDSGNLDNLINYYENLNKFKNGDLQIITYAENNYQNYQNLKENHKKIYEQKLQEFNDQKSQAEEQIKKEAQKPLEDLKENLKKYKEGKITYTQLLSSNNNIENNLIENNQKINNLVLKNFQYSKISNDFNNTKQQIEVIKNQKDQEEERKINELSIKYSSSFHQDISIEDALNDLEYLNSLGYIKSSKNAQLFNNIISYLEKRTGMTKQELANRDKNHLFITWNTRIEDILKNKENILPLSVPCPYIYESYSSYYEKDPKSKCELEKNFNTQIYNLIPKLNTLINKANSKSINQQNLKPNFDRIKSDLVSLKELIEMHQKKKAEYFSVYKCPCLINRALQVLNENIYYEFKQFKYDSLSTPPVRKLCKNIFDAIKNYLPQAEQTGLREREQKKVSPQTQTQRQIFAHERIYNIYGTSVNKYMGKAQNRLSDKSDFFGQVLIEKENKIKQAKTYLGAILKNKVKYQLSTSPQIFEVGEIDLENLGDLINLHELLGLTETHKQLDNCVTFNNQIKNANSISDFYSIFEKIKTGYPDALMVNDKLNLSNSGNVQLLDQDFQKLEEIKNYHNSNPSDVSILKNNNNPVQCFTLNKINAYLLVNLANPDLNEDMKEAFSGFQKEISSLKDQDKAIEDRIIKAFNLYAHYSLSMSENDIFNLEMQTIIDSKEKVKYLKEEALKALIADILKTNLVLYKNILNNISLGDMYKIIIEKLEKAKKQQSYQIVTYESVTLALEKAFSSDNIQILKLEIQPQPSAGSNTNNSIAQKMLSDTDFMNNLYINHTKTINDSLEYSLLESVEEKYGKAPYLNIALIENEKERIFLYVFYVFLLFARSKNKAKYNQSINNPYIYNVFDVLKSNITSNMPRDFGQKLGQKIDEFSNKIFNKDPFPLKENELQNYYNFLLKELGGEKVAQGMKIHDQSLSTTEELLVNDTTFIIGIVKSVAAKEIEKNYDPFTSFQMMQQQQQNNQKMINDIYSKIPFLKEYEKFCSNGGIHKFNQELCVQCIDWQNFKFEQNVNQVNNHDLKKVMLAYLQSPSNYKTFSNNKNKCIELLKTNNPINLSDIVKEEANHNFMSTKGRIFYKNILDHDTNSEQYQLFSIIKLVVWETLREDQYYEYYGKLEKSIDGVPCKFEVLETYLWILWYEKSMQNKNNHNNSSHFNSIKTELDKLVNTSTYSYNLNLKSPEVPKNAPFESILCAHFINKYLQKISFELNNKAFENKAAKMEGLAKKLASSTSLLLLSSDNENAVVKKLKKVVNDSCSNSFFNSPLSNDFEKNEDASLGQNQYWLPIYHSLLFLAVEVSIFSDTPLTEIHNFMNFISGKTYTVGTDSRKIGENQPSKSIDTYLKEDIFQVLKNDLKSNNEEIRNAADYLIHILPLLKRKEDHQNQINLYKNYFKNEQNEIKYKDIESSQRISYYKLSKYDIYPEFFKTVSSFFMEKSQIERIESCSIEAFSLHYKNFLKSFYGRVDAKNNFHKFLYQSLITLNLTSYKKAVKNQIEKMGLNSQIQTNPKNQTKNKKNISSTTSNDFYYGIKENDFYQFEKIKTSGDGNNCAFNALHAVTNINITRDACYQCVIDYLNNEDGTTYEYETVKGYLHTLVTEIRTGISDQKDDIIAGLHTLKNSGNITNCALITTWAFIKKLNVCIWRDIENNHILEVAQKSDVINNTNEYHILFTPGHYSALKFIKKTKFFPNG